MKFKLTWQLTALSIGLIGGATPLLAGEAERTPAVAPGPVATVQAKWLAKADELVATERARCLAHYGLTLDDLCVDRTTLSDLIGSHDAMVAHQWELYQTHRAHEDLTSPRDNAALRAVIDPILVGKVCDHIELIHCPVAGDNVAIEKLYATNTCHVLLNKTAYLTDLPRLAAILHHERAHMVYHDNLKDEILRYTIWRKLATQKNLARQRRLKPAAPLDVYAWSQSQYQIPAIAAKRLAYHRAFELRADIYAAVNAPELLRSMVAHHAATTDHEAITHPKPKTRLKVLHAIKAELAAAADADRR